MTCSTSKIEAGKLTLEKVSFDLRQCIRTGVHGFVHMATTKKLDFKQELAPDLPVRVLSDPTRFHQILLNLLSNAFKVRHAFLIAVCRTSPHCLDDWLCGSLRHAGVSSSKCRSEKESSRKCRKRMRKMKSKWVRKTSRKLKSKEKEQKPAKTKDTLIVLRIEVSDTGIGQ
jgi:signal transduction histidine kinase